MAFGAALIGTATDTANDEGFSLSLVAPTAIPANEGIIVVVAQGTSRTVSTLTDTSGNTYTRVVGGTANTANHELWECLTNLGLESGESITVTMSSTERSKAMAVYTLGGAATRVNSALTNGSSATPSVSLASLPSGAALIAALSTTDSVSLTSDADFTSDLSHLANGSDRQEFAHGSGSGTVTYNPTLGASATWRALMVAYQSSGGGSDVTGTLSATETGADTVAITGSVETSGSLSAAETGSDTASFSGSVEASGTLAATEAGGDTAAFTGSVSAPGVAGSLAATETGNDTASFSGTVTAPDVSGSLNATETGSDTASFTGTAEGGEIPTTRQGDGDILSGGQARARRHKLEFLPETALDRLVARFRAAQSTGEPEQAPKAVRRAVKAADASSAVIEAVAPVVEPAVLYRWDMALEELRQSQEREARTEALMSAIRALQEMQRQAREAEEDEEEALMLLFVA